MSNRLDCIYSLISKDSQGIADIGTDHGFIPLRLVSDGFKKTVVASDLREEPLNKAISAAEKKGVKDRISFVLTDGLNGIDRFDIDTIIIAGMGGETITGILDRDYWCASVKYTLILQPMTQAHILRFWLINNDFKIMEEHLRKDDNKIYSILKVSYGISPSYTDAELYTGRFDMIANSALFREYIDHMIHKFTVRVDGQNNSSKVENDKTINQNILCQLKEMRERFYHECQ